MKTILLLLVLVLLPASSMAQALPANYTVSSVASLKSLTVRPATVEVRGEHPGLFSWSTAPCSAADDVFQVKPTSAPSGCYARIGTPYAIGKSATVNGVLSTNDSGVPGVSTSLPSGLSIPAPAMTGGTINSSIIGGSSSQVGYFQPVYSMLNGYGNQGGGSAWQTQRHADWNVIQTSIPWNPTYWQAYSHAAMGIGRTLSGTDQVVRVRGTAFDQAWVGKNFFYWNGVSYKVSSVQDANHLTVQTAAGGAVVFSSTTNNTYYYVLTSTDSIVNTSGTTVTFVSGQPFIGLGNTIAINGKSYPVASINSPTSITLRTSAGIQTGVTSRQEYNDANVLSCLRAQGLAGVDEEALSMCMAAGEISFASVVAGSGSHRPINFYNGGKLAMSITTAQNVVVTNDGTANTALGVQNTGVGGALWYLVSKTNGDFSFFRNGTAVDAILINASTFEATFNNVVGASGFKADGVAGLTATKTVRNAAGTGTCTLEFTKGLYTGGTC